MSQNRKIASLTPVSVESQNRKPDPGFGYFVSGLTPVFCICVLLPFRLTENRKSQA
jgi:hypothetical protein